MLNGSAGELPDPLALIFFFLSLTRFRLRTTAAACRRARPPSAPAGGREFHLRSSRRCQRRRRCRRSPPSSTGPCEVFGATSCTRIERRRRRRSLVELRSSRRRTGRRRLPEKVGVKVDEVLGGESGGGLPCFSGCRNRGGRSWRWSELAEPDKESKKKVEKMKIKEEDNSGASHRVFFLSFLSRRR